MSDVLLLSLAHRRIVTFSARKGGASVCSGSVQPFRGVAELLSPVRISAYPETWRQPHFRRITKNADYRQCERSAT